MPKRLHKAVIRDLANAYDDDADQLDINVFSWCHEAANVNLTKSFIVIIIIILTHCAQIQFDQDDRYMTIQAITIEILSNAISTQIKGNVIIANIMIHTM